MPKASVAIAIIAKNASRTIGACLDSIVPYVEQVVVCVDRTSTDDTAKVAMAHGAEVYPIDVSEYHECPDHCRVLAQHFAKARQESFACLRKDVAFHGWVDSDDVVVGGEKLSLLLEKLPPEVDGVWFPYNYAQAGQDGPSSTMFDRERLVRTSRAWAWQYRVHEILAPVGIPTEHLNWTRTEDIVIKHQGEGHDTAGSARRNILLLEIDLEEDPNDMRAWFYLGNQYFALGEWATAAECYQRSTEAQNPYQLWQSLVYLSMSCQKLGDLATAKQSAFRALDVQPQHPEPYYQLAAVYMLQGDKERCEFWTQIGDQMPDPPPFVFRNPLDRPFNARLNLATAYANAGESSKARRELERAARAVPTKEILEGVAYHRQLEEDAKKADAVVSLLTSADATDNFVGIMGFAKNHEAVWRFGRVRDVVVPVMLKNRPNTQPRVVFWCGKSMEPWAPPSLNTTGIGGSETAVIQIAKRFAADGWRADVYNDCDKYEGEYEGVGYWDLRRFGAEEHADLTVVWRNPQVHDLPIDTRLRALWCHDLNQGPAATEHMGKWDLVLGVSRWHADYLAAVYGLDHPTYVPNGIELERFVGEVKRIPFRCVYASSPDRGLERLLDLWPRIVAQEPSAELHIAYGWENIDKYVQMGHPNLGHFKQYMVSRIEHTPNVVWRGRLPQDELARLYQESSLWTYPACFVEVSCISAMEAMAAGCVPVTSAVGALPETIGEAGLVVKGNVYTRAWRDFYVSCLRAAMASPEVRKPLQAKGLERAMGFTWDRSYQDHWKPLVEARLISGKVDIQEREKVAV